MSWNLKPSSLAYDLMGSPTKPQALSASEERLKKPTLLLPPATPNKHLILLTLSSNRQKHINIKILAFHKHPYIPDPVLARLCVN